MNRFMTGKYFFGDFCSGDIWMLTRKSSGKWTGGPVLHTGLQINSFGEDEDGELYVVPFDSNATIYRIRDLLGTGPVDLVAQTLEVAESCKKGLCSAKSVKLTYQNVGSRSKVKSFVDFYLSDDDQLTTDGITSDTLIRRVPLSPVPAGAIKKKSLSKKWLLAAGAHTGQRVIAVLDPENLTDDTNTTNNIAVSSPLP
jgi:hypothetical protein